MDREITCHSREDPPVGAECRAGPFANCKVTGAYRRGRFCDCTGLGIPKSIVVGRANPRAVRAPGEPCVRTYLLESHLLFSGERIEHERELTAKEIESKRAELTQIESARADAERAKTEAELAAKGLE